ncbi:MAG: hypothetical protein AAFO29_01155, partial [Actinomycetota bacterium]
STVGLTVIADPEAEVREAISALRSAGHDVTVADVGTTTAPGPGIVIRHGVDGANAAALVADNLGGATLEPVSGLSGRSVVVVLGPEPIEAIGAEVAAPSADSGDEAGATADDPDDADVTEVDPVEDPLAACA